MPPKGRYHRNWFSNYEKMDEPLPVKLSTGEIIYFHTVENWHQAMKSNDQSDWKRIAAMTPQASKPAGKAVSLRPNYTDEMAIALMDYALHHKFKPGTSWHKKLMDTGDDEIVEWNNWWDRRWGRTINTQQGTNWLGLLLMRLRAEYRGIDVSAMNILALAA
jgi:predicted NAD-dependent protein-ADP-ribosyltransferase YbiA (DUF1768 family)